MKELVILLGLILSFNASAKIEYNESQKREIQCLKEAIYFEARSESTGGQIAVAHVIMNRKNDSRWSNNVCDVVHEKAQFSYYWDGKPEIYDDKKAEEMAYLYAEIVYSGTTLDITDGSTMYHATYMIPDWDFSKLKRTMTLDGHIFYVYKK